jgi:hypothetical protein
VVARKNHLLIKNARRREISAKRISKVSKKRIDKREKVCYTHCIKEIEAHCTKSIARKKPPRLCEKGVGAEADTVAGIFCWQLGKDPFCCRGATLEELSEA